MPSGVRSQKPGLGLADPAARVAVHRADAELSKGGSVGGSGSPDIIRGSGGSLML